MVAKCAPRASARPTMMANCLAKRHVGDVVHLISDNILTTRLKRLVEAGIFERSRYQRRPDRYEYLLTGKGRALGPVVAALRDWGSAWTEGSDRTKIAHRACGHPVSVRLYCPDCNRQITGAEIGPA